MEATVNYTDMTVPELKKLASERNLGTSAWRSNANKAELIAVLNAGMTEAEPTEKDPNELILMYSITPSDKYRLRKGSVELVKLANGTYREVSDKQHDVLHFRNHRAWVTAAELAHIRSTFVQYGNKIMEAFPQNDGDSIAVSLDGLLESDSEADNNQGAGFITSLAKASAASMRVPVKEAEIRNELRRWKAGKLEKPTKRV